MPRPLPRLPDDVDTEATIKASSGRGAKAIESDRIAHIREIVRRTRTDQGLPPTIKHELTLDRIAVIFALPPVVRDDEPEVDVA